MKELVKDVEKDASTSFGKQIRRASLLYCWSSRVTDPITWEKLQTC